MRQSICQNRRGNGAPVVVIDRHHVAISILGQCSNATEPATAQPVGMLTVMGRACPEHPERAAADVSAGWRDRHRDRR
jgi:hypothetical protein